MTAGVRFRILDRLGANPYARISVLCLLGALLLTVSSYIAIPTPTAPITMQTLAVTSIGALYGWRLGMGAVFFWLALGAMGAPVFAGGASGVAQLAGATGGYLLAFPFAAALTGALVQRGWDKDRKARAFAAMLSGNFLSLVAGATWLATKIGFERAVEVGFLPFIPGAVVKSAMGVVVLLAVSRGAAEGDRRAG